MRGKRIEFQKHELYVCMGLALTHGKSQWTTTTLRTLQEQGTEGEVSGVTSYFAVNALKKKHG